jgi:hypothetical protein
MFWQWRTLPVAERSWPPDQTMTPPKLHARLQVRDSVDELCKAQTLATKKREIAGARATRRGRPQFLLLRRVRPDVAKPITPSSKRTSSPPVGISICHSGLASADKCSHEDEADGTCARRTWKRARPDCPLCHVAC